MSTPRSPEEKEKVLRLARDKVPARAIAEQTGVPRETVYYWLRVAGITPTPPQRQERPKTFEETTPPSKPRRESKKTLGNLPLALRIERNVRRRVEEMADESDVPDGAAA